MSDPVLWHIEISHYNEKARWALQYKGVAHRRRAPLPGFLSPLCAYAMTRELTFPILQLDGETIGDSTRIIAALERRFPEPSLYPEDPAERRRALEVEDFFDEHFAAEWRRLAFYELSRDPAAAADALALIGGPALPGPPGRVLAAAVARAVALRYGGRHDELAVARERVAAGVARLAELIGPSGYLVGDRFTVADLTAASLLMHIARPPQLEYPIPPPTPAVEEFLATLPPEPIEWVRGIYRAHRHARPAAGVVLAGS